MGQLMLPIIPAMVIRTTDARWKLMSLRKIHGSTTVGQVMASEPTTMVVTNTLPPRSAPIPIKASLLPAKEVTDENISGDPFPMARNDTPAIS